MTLTLYDYWRSSAAYRVRIALYLKGVEFESIPIDIAPGTDEQFGESYRFTNPQMRIPSISVDGRVSGQSMAIIEWLDETLPGNPLLPTDPWQKLEARAFADTIACDIHPLNNLSVLKQLRESFGADDEAITHWYHDWIKRGFDALEITARKKFTGNFLFGDAPTLAEIALIPQISNARRYKMDLSAYDTLVEIDRRCQELTPFQLAAPKAPA